MEVRSLALFALLALSVGLSTGGVAQERVSPMDEALRVEARGNQLLLEHYRIEQALLAPDADRLTVFLSLPPGPPVVLEEASLHLDGRVIVRHRYSANDLARLADGGVQPLYVGSIPPGNHQIRLEVKTRQGKVQALGAHTFVKTQQPGFVEFQIAGEAGRPVRVSSW